MSENKKDTTATPQASEERVETLSEKAQGKVASAPEAKSTQPPSAEKKSSTRRRLFNSGKSKKSSEKSKAKKAPASKEPVKTPEEIEQEAVKKAITKRSPNHINRSPSLAPNIPMYNSYGILTSVSQTSKEHKTPEAERLREEIEQDFRASLDPNSRLKLTGTLIGSNTLQIQGEPPLVIALVLYKGAVINIPAHDFLVPYKNYETGEVFNYTRYEYPSLEIKKLLKRRFGSEVDFRVTTILEDGTAVASRLRAMDEIKERWWVNARSKIEKDENGNALPYIREGQLAKARIVCVINSGIYIELLGVEAFLPNSEIGHTFIDSAKSCFSNGQTIDVIITKITKFEDGTIRFKASNRLVDISAHKDTFDRIKINDNYQGEIVDIRYNEKTASTHFLVKISDEIQVQCVMGPGVIRYPRMHSRVEIRITDKYREKMKLGGFVVHILKY